MTWPSSDFGRVGLGFGLHVADHVLLDEEAQVAVVQVLGQRRRQRQDVGGEVAHLLRHLQLRARRRGSAVRARRGGRGAPRRRRSGASTARRRGPAAGRRPAGSPAASTRAQWRSAAASSAAEVAAAAPFGVPRMTRIRSISSGSRPVSRGDHRHRHLALVAREELLGEAEGQAALAARACSGPRASGRARASAPRPGPGRRRSRSSGRAGPGRSSPRPSV